MLTTLELHRLQQAYGSDFYRRLMEARRELADALDSIDNAIRDYETAKKEERRYEEAA